MRKTHSTAFPYERHGDLRVQRLQIRLLNRLEGTESGWWGDASSGREALNEAWQDIIEVLRPRQQACITHLHLLLSLAIIYPPQ